MQVKFRGKRVDGQGWVVGSLITSDFNVSRKDYYIRLQSWDDVHGYLTYPVVPESVGMFTGLTDKHGKEIYGAIGEKGGDILRWKSSNPFSKGEIRTVEVIYSQARFWCKGKIGVYLGELLVEEKCEIIGNATDNPELLEK